MQKRLFFTFVITLFLAGCFSKSSTEQAPATFKKIDIQFEEINLSEGETKYFDIELSIATVEDINLKWTISGPDAASRFVFTQGTVAVTRGSKKLPVQIQTSEDAVYNPDIQYTITLEELSDSRQSLSLIDQTFTLIDNDPKPEISFSSPTASALESVGNSPVYVSLDRAAGKDVVFDLQINGASVADASDISNSLSFTISAGDTSSFFNLSIVDDINVEGNENLILDIVGIKYDAIDLLIDAGNSQHTFTIFDNESTIMPDPTAIVLSDATANSGYARGTLVDVAITEDPTTLKWCLSELQTSMPANGSALCLGGTGPSNGWHTTEPTSFNLSSGEGVHTVYIWTANIFDDVNDNAVTASIILDTIAPTITIDKASGQADPATALPVNFSLEFSEEVIGLLADASQVSHSGTSFLPSGSITTSDSISFNYAVNDLHSNGTIIPSVVASMVTDLAGNPNTASSSGADDTVEVNLPTGVDVYRSVGLAAVIEQGTTNPMKIISNIAIFSNPLADRISVGDALVFDSNQNTTIDSVAFVSERISQTHFKIQNEDGSTINLNTQDITDWEIYRSYTSLENAENGTVNSNIPVPFDAWSGGYDLVANNLTWNIVLADNITESLTGPFTIGGWETSGFHFLNIFTTYKPEQSKNRSRHKGLWDASYYTLSSPNRALVIDEAFISIRGLQIEGDPLNTGHSIISMRQNESAGIQIFSENIFKGINTGAGQGRSGISFGVGSQSYRAILANNFFRNHYSYPVVRMTDTLTDVHILNNTSINARFEFSGVDSQPTFINNIIQASGVTLNLLFSASFNSNSDYNINSGSESTGGANDKISTSLSYFNSAGGDFRLSLNDATNNQGLDLSSYNVYVINEDIMGLTRRSFEPGAYAANLASYLWIGGSSSNWSDDANWYGLAAPSSSSDSIYFNYLSGNATVDIDTNIDVASLNLEFGFSGSLEQLSGNTLRANVFEIQSGSFLGGDSDIIIENHLKLEREANFRSTSGNLLFTFVNCCSREEQVFDGVFDANSGLVAIDTVETGSADWTTAHSISFFARSSTEFHNFRVDVRDNTAAAVKNWQYVGFKSGSIIKIAGDLVINDGNILTQDFRLGGDLYLNCDDFANQDCAEIPTSPGRYGYDSVAGVIFDDGLTHSIYVTQGAAGGSIRIENNSTVNIVNSGSVNSVSFQGLIMNSGTFNHLASTDLILKSEFNSYYWYANKNELLNLTNGSNFNLNGSKVVLNPRTHRAATSLTPENAWVQVDPSFSFNDLDIIVDTEGKDIVLTRLNAPNNPLNVLGNLNISGDGIVQADFNLSGNLNVNSNLGSLISNVVFNGTSDQIYTNSDDETLNGNITINKASGDVYFASATDLDTSAETLDIQSGNLFVDVSLNVAGTINIEAGNTLNTQCNTVTYGALTGAGTINGGVGTPSLSVSPVSADESSNLSFVVDLNNYTCSGSVDVDYSLAEGTARLIDSDYVNTSGTLSFGPGETSKTVVVTVNDDSYWEESESLTLTLANPVNGTIATASALGTILDNDNAGVGFVWTGNAADDNWSSTGNWSGGSVPGVSDVAYLDGASCTNCNISIDVPVNVKAIRSFSNYTGTLTQASGQTVTVTDGSMYLLSGVTFNGSDANITMADSIFLSTGSFNSTTATLEVSDQAIDLSSGTHDFNKGLFFINNDFLVNANARYSLDGVSFNNFRLQTYSDIFFNDSTITVNGDLIYRGVHVSGQIQDLTADIHGNLTGLTGTGGCGGGMNAAFRLVGTGNQTWSSADPTCEFPSVIINKSSGTATLSGDLRTNDDFRHLAGVVDTTGSTITLVKGVNTSSIQHTTGMEFNNLTVQKTGAALYLASDIVVNGTFTYDSTSDNSNAASHRYILKGDVHLENTPTNGLQPVEIAGSGAQNYSRNSGKFRDITFNHTGTFVNGNVSVFSYDGAVTYTQGSFGTPLKLYIESDSSGSNLDLNSLSFDVLRIRPLDSVSNVNIVSDMNITGSLETISNGVHNIILGGLGQIYIQGDLDLLGYSLYTTNGYLIELNGTGAQNITCGTSCRGPGVRINSSGSVTFPGTFGSTGGVEIVSGTVDLSSTSINLDWAHSDAILDLNGNTLNYLGLSKDGGYDVTIVGTANINKVGFSTVGVTDMALNGGEIQINESLVAPSAGGGSTQLRFVGNENATIDADTTANIPGPGIIVDKTGGVLDFVGNVNLNITGEDFNILQGDVRMNGFNLNINDNLNIAAGSTLYTDCGNLTYSTLSGTGTVTTSETTPQISVSDLLLEEGETGDVIVSLNLPNCSNTITVDYSFNQVTASLGDNDYTSSNSYSGSLSFAPGEYQKTINVQSIEDTIMEDDETLTIDISTPTNATIADAQGVVTINNDDTSNFIWIGGVDSNWSTPGNWQGGAAPTNTDVAFFNNSCGVNCDVTIDTSIDVLGIRTDASYTGTITQASGNTITIGSADLRMKGGAFIGGDSLIDLNGDFELNNASFTATSGRMELGYDGGNKRFEGVTIINGASFIHNSGTFALLSTRFVNTSTSDGITGVFNLDSDLNLWNLEINGRDAHNWPNYGNVIYLFDATEKVVVNGSFDFIDGYLREGTIEIKGNVTVHGNGNHFADGGSTKLEFTGTSPQTIDLQGTDPTFAVLPHMVLNSTSTLSVDASDSSLKAFGLTIQNGTFESPATLELTANRHAINQDPNLTDFADIGLSFQGGTFNHNNGKLLLTGVLHLEYFGGITSFIDIPSGIQVYDLEVDITDSSSNWGNDNAGFYIKEGHTMTVLNNMTMKDGMFVRGAIELLGDLYLEQTSTAVRAEGGYGRVLFNDGGTHTIYAQDGAMAPSIEISGSTTLGVDAATSNVVITSLNIDPTSTFNGHTGTLQLGSYIHDMGRPYVYYESDNYQAHAGSIGLVVSGTINTSNTDLRIVPGLHGESSASIFKVDVNSPITVANLEFKAYSTYVASRGLISLHNSSSFVVLGDLLVSDGNVGEVVSGNTEIFVAGDVSFTNTDANVYAASFEPKINLNGTLDQSITISSGSFLSPVLEVSNGSGQINLASDLNIESTGADLIMGASSTFNLNGFNLTINDSLTMDASSVVNEAGGNLIYSNWNGLGTINP